MLVHHRSLFNNLLGCPHLQVSIYTNGSTGDLMVGALVPRKSSPGWSSGRGHCVVLLGKTLYSTVPLSTQEYSRINWTLQTWKREEMKWTWNCITFMQFEIQTQFSNALHCLKIPDLLECPVVLWDINCDSYLLLVVQLRKWFKTKWTQIVYSKMYKIAVLVLSKPILKAHVKDLWKLICLDCFQSCW